MTDDVREVADRAAGRPVDVVLPRRLLTGNEATAPVVAARAVLAAGGSWATHWREPGKVLVTSDLSGARLCLDCLAARERAGCARPAHGVDARPARDAESPDPAATALLLTHAALRLRAPTRFPDGAVLLELRPRQADLTRVLGLPTCPLCAPGAPLDLAGTPQAGDPAPLDVLLPSSLARAPRPRRPFLPDGAGAPPHAPQHAPAPAIAPAHALAPATLAERCRRSHDLSPERLAALTHDLRALHGPRGVLRTLRTEHPAVAADLLHTADLFHAVTGDLADLREISASHAQPQLYDAFGAAWTMADAVRRCLGEAVERYCALVHGAARRVVWGAARDLPNAVPLERFATFSDREKPAVEADFPTASAASPLGWVHGHSLTRGGPVLVPAQLSLLGYTAAAFEDAVQPGSNKGLAAGKDADACLVHGLCELIEADALLIHFLNRAPVPELALDTTGHPRVDRAHRALRATGGRLRAWDFATDLAVPTVLAMVERHDGTGPLATFGMATRLDPGEALEKAVLEALHGTCWLTGQLVEEARAFPGAPDAAWVTERERAKALGASPGYLDALGWLLIRERRRPFAAYAAAHPPAPSTPGAGLDLLVETLRDAGLEAVAVDLSTPDVRAATGLQVWRAVVPGLQPFSIGPLQARENARLRTVPVRMGHRAAPLPESALNPLPHPCP